MGKSSKTKPTLECEKNDKGVYLPTYSLYLIGTIMIIMLLVIIYLMLILCRRKITEYKVATRQAPTPSVIERGYDKQESADRSINKPMVKELSACKLTINEDTLRLTPKIYIDTRDNETTSSNTNIRTNTRVKKCTSRSTTNVITPDKMKEIISEVLNKRMIDGSTSSKDLNAFINEISTDSQRHSGEKLKKLSGRSFSTPMLDIYDTLPTANNKAVNDQYLNDDEDNISLYDKPVKKQVKDPVVNVVNHCDTVYLLPFSSATEGFVEPSYINARQRHMY